MCEPYMKIDSIDAKFNETFSPCRERKGKLTSGAVLDPDLTTDPNDDDTQVTVNKLIRCNDDLDFIENNQEGDNVDVAVIDPTVDATMQKYGRGKRLPVQRQFFQPGTGSGHKVKLEPLPKPLNTEFQIRDQQYANLCMNMDNDEHTLFVLACLESQRDEEAILTK